jgi:putative DNA primase/helicase
VATVDAARGATCPPDSTPAVNTDGIPPELIARDQWGCWRAKRKPGKPKPTKVPYQVDGTNASSTDPSTWTTFRAALEAYQRGGFDGIGYFFSAEDPYVGVDIDHARSDQERLAWALDIVRSPYGEGIHVIGRGRLPGGGRNDQKIGLEVYDRDRFFTVTGRRVEVGP